MYIRRCLILAAAVLVLAGPSLAEHAVTASKRTSPAASTLALTDSNGLSSAYIYFQRWSDHGRLYRRLKSGGEFQVACSLLWRNSAYTAALDPSGCWLVEAGNRDSFMRKHDIVHGTYTDCNLHREAQFDAACDSAYVYVPINSYVYRYRLGDMGFIDSTWIDQPPIQGLIEPGFGFANDSLWVSDTVTGGFYVYPASSISGESAYAVRFQPTGDSLHPLYGVTWDGQNYYVMLAYPPNHLLRRYSLDWTSHSDQPMPGFVNPMAVDRPAFQSDVGTIRVTPPHDPIPARVPTEVQAVAMNFGQATQGPFDVVVSLGGLRRTRTVSSLAPGDSTKLTFSAFVPDSSGLITIRCSTALSGDQDHSNDVAVDTAGTVVADYVETFEGTNGGFEADPPDTWAWGAPAAPRPLPRSGDHVWGDRLAGTYGGGEVAAVISPVYQALVDTPILAYYQWYKYHFGDGGNCGYSTDGGDTWYPVDPWRTHPYDDWIDILQENGWIWVSGTGWSRAMHQIPVSRGANFTLRWHCGSEVGDTGQGWIIDDVAGMGFVRSDVAAEEHRTATRTCLSISPSLVRSTAHVRYSLSRAGNVSLKLYDATGRLVRCLLQGQEKAGPLDYVLRASDLSRGVYILGLETEGCRLTRKLVLE